MSVLSRRGRSAADVPSSRRIGGCLAALLVVVVGVFAGIVPAVPASAESNVPTAGIRAENTFYAYVGAGESLDARFVQSGEFTSGAATTVTVNRPGGAPVSCVIPATAPAGFTCGWSNLASPEPGIWSISYLPTGGVQQGRYSEWDISVRNAGGEIPGRVWTEQLTILQPRSIGIDIPLYYQAVTGDQYRATYLGFFGVDSSFSADAIGIRANGTCDVYYESALPRAGAAGLGTPHSVSAGECGPRYKIFFDEPSSDLPESAVRFDGTTDWILPEIVEPAVTDISFTPTSGSVQAGTIAFAVEDFFGAMDVQIDANGNGTYDDPEDVTIPYSVVDGTGSLDFDGVDGLGNPIPTDRQITVRAHLDRTGEIHFVNADVEARDRGIEVVSMRGSDAGNTTLYWDDSYINTQQAARCSALNGPVSAPNGVDSTGGVHSWTLCPAGQKSNPNDGISGSYGDVRLIQEWTYRVIDVERAATVPARAADITVTKSADPASGTAVLPGQVVNYTLTFENSGDADGIVDHDDVIEGVLDDATLTTPPAASDAALTVSPVVDGRFSVDGTLVAGQSVTVTYAVTVKANGERGDSVLGNFVVPGGDEPPTECADDSSLCTVHPVPQLEITKTSDSNESTRVGDTVTYTVSATNVGGLAYTEAVPAELTDDLTGVLDDAEYNGDAASDLAGLIGYSEPKISWSGALDIGDTVTLTYSVTMAPGGDGVVRNVAFHGTPDLPTPECDPPGVDGTDPESGLACAETVFELPRLIVEKTSDVTDLPADGGVVTYTVMVTNAGPGAYTEEAPAVSTDDLSDVLDDAEFGGMLAPAEGARFDAEAETLTWSGPLAPGASVAISYTVVYDATTGDNVLYNVVCVPAAEVAPGDDNCADVRIPAASLEVEKSVDPSDGASVEAGQTVTYLLSFISTGQAAATVDKVDDLSGVLDDAELVAGSIAVSNPGITADLQGTDLVVTGSVPAGETFTVTYSVTVNAYADQADHILANVVQNPDGTCDVGGCPQTENPIRHFRVAKSATPTEGVETGDVVEYTITVTNDGEGDYTMSSPAGVRDDMSDVLDDAVYDGGATALASDGSSVPAPAFEAPVLTWSGPIAVGESVDIRFRVTVTNRGDADLVNVATPVCAPAVICDPDTPPVVILLPRITPEKSSDPVTGSDVIAGQVVTYTVTFTNDGQAAGDIDATDDLARVLDDAHLTGEPVSDVDGITAIYDTETQALRISGSLGAGATVTVTYQVTVKADGDRGDNILTNVLTPDVPPYVCADGDAECDPFTPPSTEHFVGELDDGKTVDPASGSTVRAGQVVTYTLHFENTGEAPVAVDREDALSQVLDDATVTAVPVSSDPALTVSPIDGDRFSITGVLAPAQRVTVVYQVTVNADGARGDDRLGNFLVDTGEEPPSECVPLVDERADCTVNHVSDVVVEKSANPASGTEVREGDRVTYTLTFRNVSTNQAAAAADIDYTDHLADVLDDASLTAGPVSSSESVTSTVAGDSIRVIGAISAGQTVTVTYTVAVKTWAAQGDHRLGNVVAVTGEEPLCAPGNGLCTSHPVSEPDPLAATGGAFAGGVAVAGVLLILLGGVLLAARSRRGAAREIG